jgi:hypothetical protein
VARDVDHVPRAVDAKRVRVVHGGVADPELAERRRFVNHRLRREPIDGLEQCLAVHDVCDDGPGAEQPEPVRSLVAARYAEHLVVCRMQLLDERDADRPGGAGDQDLHGVSFAAIRECRYARETGHAADL